MALAHCSARLGGLAHHWRFAAQLAATTWWRTMSKLSSLRDAASEMANRWQIAGCYLWRANSMLQTRSSNSFCHQWCLPHFLEPHVPHTLSLLFLFYLFLPKKVWRWSGLTFTNCLASSALAKPSRCLISANHSDVLNSREPGNFPESNLRRGWNVQPLSLILAYAAAPPSSAQRPVQRDTSEAQSRTNKCHINAYINIHEKIVKQGIIYCNQLLWN